MKGNIISYEGKTVKQADAKSFKSLGYGYGKDNNHVYYLGKILEYVDPDGFKTSIDFQIPKENAKKNSKPAENKEKPTTSDSNSKTTNKGFENLTKINDILNRGTVITFEDMPSDSDSVAVAAMYKEYTKKEDGIYYGDTKVEGAIPNSFTDLGIGYGKDDVNVYYIGLKLPGAQPSSFEILKGLYCRDELSAYYKGQKLPNANGKDFKYEGNGFASDGIHYFIYGNKIEK